MLNDAIFEAARQTFAPPKTLDYDVKRAQARAGTGAVRMAARRPSTTVAITAAA
ncbi:hypothetical protein PT2222_90156 [Paraburkholderia tropica]